MTKRDPRNPLDHLIIFSESSTSSAPISTLDLIPTARQVKRDAKTQERIAKRKASRAAFDKKYPCYPYHIPEHLHEEAREVRAIILGLSQNKDRQINVTEINMTTELISWALTQVRMGKLVITGTPNSSRRKLTVVIEDVTEDWGNTPIELKPGKKRVPSKRVVFTYRFPHDVTTQIENLAGDALPRGEVLVRLLQYAVNAYKNRAIQIRPSSIEVRQTATVVEVNHDDSWT